MTASQITRAADQLPNPGEMLLRPPAQGPTNPDGIWLAFMLPLQAAHNAHSALGRTLDQAEDVAAAQAALELGTMAGEEAGDYLTVAAAAAGYQPLDADLTAYSANSTDGFWAHTGAGTGAARTLIASIGISITNPAGIAGNPSFSVNQAFTPIWTGLHTHQMASGTVQHVWANNSTTHAMGVRFQSTGTNFAFVPMPSGAVAAAQELTYDFTGTRWTFDGNLTVAGTATFTLAPVFTDASGTRTALGLGDIATLNLASTYAWTGAHTITLATSAATPLNLVSTNADAVAGPLLTLDRQSASPAAADAIAQITMAGRDSGGNNANYLAIRGNIVDPTDASEDGRMDFLALVGGANGVRWSYSAGLFYGGGSDMGANTVNAINYYNTGVKVVGNRVTGWTASTGTAERGAYATYTAPNISAAYVEAEVQAIADALQIVSRQLKAMKDDLIAHGLIGT